VGRLARIILELDWLRDALALEAAMEGDDSPQPVRLQAIISELCGFLDRLAAEETCAILDSASSDDEPLAQCTAKSLAAAAGALGAARITALLKTGNSNMQKLAADLLAKTKHSQGDQALVELAHYACDNCIKIDGLTGAAQAHLSAARNHLFQAGAVPWTAAAAAATGNSEPVPPQMKPPRSEFRVGGNATVDTSKGPDDMDAPRSQPGRAHQSLMDIAHECIGKLTDGMVCCDRAAAPGESADAQEVAEVGARHSAETMGHLRAAHDHLVAAGAECDGATVSEEEHEGTRSESVKAGHTGSFAKLLADERAEKTALVKALGEMVPLLDRLSKRVDDIARTPLPPLTIARGSVSVSKAQDGAGTGAADKQLSPEAIASALAKMSKEEQTLTLIKASYANPIRVLGVAPGER